MMHDTDSKLSVHDVPATHESDLQSIKIVSRQSSIRNIKPQRMSILDNVFFCALLCAIGGCATATQGAINSTLGRFIGQGLSSTIVFTVGAATSAIYWMIEVRGRPPANLPTMLAKAPWWAWTGGILGACFVIITILAIPRVGAGTTTAIIVSSKLIMGCVIDHFQLLGVSVHRKYTIWRMLATVTLIGCTVVIAMF
ncbi:hypothetical protein BGW42_004828 [Actinomortierella wolfii]|nr:hypothetical protein BGW42_004828 [Actinomortierella wolfii]KAG0227071.1 hypothetical protein BGW41_003993 [Actinomortierella wolfii]